MQIGHLNAFTDNYIWFIRSGNDIIVIDPGESVVVLDYIITNQLNLKAILLTHDHHDHMGGVADILAYSQVPVFGMGKIPSHKLHGGELTAMTEQLTAQTMVTPGHTYTSICYMFNIDKQKHLFCGDTLFAAGCGRVFTGDFVAMYDSLTRLGELDPEFLVYPGHEYTLKNLQFALSLEPNNPNIKKRIKVEQDKLNTFKITLPVTMAIEQLTNPFLRCTAPEIVNRVGEITGNTPEPGLACFIQLRELRNNF